MDYANALPTKQPLLAETGIEHQGIEVASEKDIVNMDLEKFMHEPVTVRILPVPGLPKTVPITLNVCGVPQHVFPGINQTIRRKYVEVLARAVRTDYEQDEKMMIEGLLPYATSMPAYAFTVVRDDNPRGMDWLADIQRQAV